MQKYKTRRKIQQVELIGTGAAASPKAAANRPQPLVGVGGAASRRPRRSTATPRDSEAALPEPVHFPYNFDPVFFPGPRPLSPAPVPVFAGFSPYAP